MSDSHENDDDAEDLLGEFVEAARDVLEAAPGLLAEGSTAQLAADLRGIARSADFLMLGNIVALVQALAVAFLNPEFINDAAYDGLDCLQHIIDAVERDRRDGDYSDEVTRVVDALGGDALLEKAQEPQRRAVTTPSTPMPTTSLPQGPPATGLPDLFRDEAYSQLDEVEHILLRIEKGGSTEDVPEAFRAIHSFKGNCGCVGLFEIEGFAHRLEDALDQVRGGAQTLTGPLTSALLAGIDAIRTAIVLADSTGGTIANTDALLAQLDAALDVPPLSHPQVPGDPVYTQDASPSSTDSTTSPSSPAVSAPPATKTTASKPVSRFVRVEVDKLDLLLNEVGELISASAAVVQNPDLSGLDLSRFNIAASHLHRVTTNIHDAAMSMRMVPLRSQFQKLARVVRDLRERLGKAVDVEVVGEQTEMDKSVIEAIADPLIHVVRNAIDHGIESESERTAAAKPSAGTVRLTAKHQGGEVWIVVEDDGRGIDPESVRASAVAKGLIRADDRLTDQEALELLFFPGFSTASAITNVSGRGVGMDVVKREIEAVRGRVDIRSRIGHGTTVTIRLPMTLAVIDAMLIRTDSNVYALPLLTVRESVNAQANDLTRLPDGSVSIRIRDRLYPVVSLKNFYEGRPSHPDVRGGIFVFVQDNDEQYCLAVDEVVGQRQIVIKALDGLLRNVRGVSGCSLLGNGEICLILDVAGIVRTLRETRARPARAVA